MLGDASGFSGGAFGFADRVEKAGLAVIDVAHHRHNGRPWLKILRFFFPGDFLNDIFFKCEHFDDAIECFRKARSRCRVERLIDAGEDAAIEQNLQDFLRAHIEFFRQIADRHAFGNCNFAWLARRRRGRALNMRGASLSRTHSGANRMQLAFAFFEALLDCGTRARRGLALINWLSRLRLGRHFVRRQCRSWTSSGARTTWAAWHWLSGTHRNLLSRAAWSSGARRKSGLWSAGPCTGCGTYGRGRVHTRAGRLRIPIWFGSGFRRRSWMRRRGRAW